MDATLLGGERQAMSSDGIALGQLEGVYPLLDLLQVGFVLVGPGGGVRHATGQARSLLGRRRVDAAALAEVLGDLAADLVTPVLSGRVRATRWREHRFAAPDGGEIEIAVRSVAVDADGARAALLAFYDISVEVGLHRRYKALLARQEAINDELRRRIAEELREHEDDLAQFGELLRVAPAIFASFVAEAGAAVAAIAVVAGAEALDDGAAITALRESHTLKGNARGLGLHFIAGRAHAVEDLIAEARRDGAAAPPAELDLALSDLRRAIERAVAVRGGLAGDGDGDGAGDDGDDGAAALTELGAALDLALAALDPGHPERARLERARATARRLARIPLSQLLHYLRVTARAVAASTGREAPIVEVRGGGVAVPRAVHDALHAALPHLVRNAIVHGLEPDGERIAAGKPAAGTITVDARVDGDRLVVTLTDDGRGIDRDRLAAALAATGGAVPPELSLADLLFHPGLSTRVAADLDAGRGMGAPAARDALTAIGGTLVVASAPGRGTTFTATVPVRAG
jgi:chemotaxis protein histidine kinase CheA